MKSLVLTQLSASEVRDLFRQELEQFFSSNLVKTETENPEQRIVSLDGLREARPHIGTKSTIYKLTSTGGIPHSRRGKRLYFDLDKIDQWLMSNTIKTAEEIEEETDKYLSRKK